MNTPPANRALPLRSLRAILWMSVLCLGGCATTPAPVEQIKFFSQAFVAVNAVGQPLLDDLALAERKVGKRAAERRAQRPPTAGEACTSQDATWATSSDPKLGFIDGFCLEDATYFASLGDPPATAQLRGGLRVIERYAEVLASLAEGTNLDQALGQVEALGQEVGGLLALTGGSVALTPALTALRPLLGNIAKQANADEARRLIVDGAPTVGELIAGLRKAAPEMFKILISDPRRALHVAATAPAAVKEVDLRRIAVSDYVVLLDRLYLGWGATVAAARNPGGSRLSDLVALSAEIRADAEAVRRTLALLRSGVQAP